MCLNDHLLSRYLDVTKYSNVDLDGAQATFPLWNMSGKMVGYQTYNPTLPKVHVDNPREARYFTWVTKPSASPNSELAVWGLETVHWTDKVLFLTEGVFDAARLHWHGLPAVAVLGNNPKPLLSWLYALPSHKVACVQGDQAGMKLAKFGDSALFLPTGHDVGDLSEEQFMDVFGKYLQCK